MRYFIQPHGAVLRLPSNVTEEVLNNFNFTSDTSIVEIDKRALKGIYARQAIRAKDMQFTNRIAKQLMVRRALRGEKVIEPFFI